MAWLAESDVSLVLDFANAADEEGLADREQARRFIVCRVPDLAGGDGAILTEWDDRVSEAPTSGTDPSVAATRASEPDLWRSLLRRGGHPIVARWQRSPDSGALRMSDVIDRCSFHHLELFDTFLRPHGIERAVGVRVPDGASHVLKGFDLSVYRTGARTSDFTERRAGILAHVGIHVEQILQRADMHPFVTGSMARLGLSRREAEVAPWTSKGKTNAEIARILFLAPGTVKKHLDNIYRRLSIRTRTQVAILVMDAGSRVAGQRYPHDASGLNAAAVGLTPKERAVLSLVAEGYSSATVAANLNFSSATAKTHLDHIYRKLGVTTRTEAVVHAYAHFEAERA
jgi:DNA-binding CsgD family transcriptional regulator